MNKIGGEFTEIQCCQYASVGGIGHSVTEHHTTVHGLIRMKIDILHTLNEKIGGEFTEIRCRQYPSVGGIKGELVTV
jgi:hypothetical protein